MGAVIASLNSARAFSHASRAGTEPGTESRRSGGSPAIVAEGVETQEEWDLVAALGVDIVQGYFVAKPMPGEEIAAWMEGYQSA
jgi:hypothetical protein